MRAAGGWSADAAVDGFEQVPASLSDSPMRSISGFNMSRQRRPGREFGVVTEAEIDAAALSGDLFEQEGRRPPVWPGMTVLETTTRW
jgi:hypothetical protein